MLTVRSEILCVRVCVCACVRVCVRLRARARARVLCARECARACASGEEAPAEGIPTARNEPARHRGDAKGSSSQITGPKNGQK